MEPNKHNIEYADSGKRNENYISKKRERGSGGLVAIAVLFGLCVCGWAGLNLGFNNFEYSRGARTGMINKIARKGYIFKTYEGEMALEGITSGSNSTGANVWDFSIDYEERHCENREELEKQVEDALSTGTKVKVEYIQQGMVWPWRAKTRYLIQKITPVKKNSAKVEEEQ